MLFYAFVQSFHLCFFAKQNFIDFNNGEATEFLVSPSSDFRAFKNACTEIILSSTAHLWQRDHVILALFLRNGQNHKKLHF